MSSQILAASVDQESDKTVELVLKSDEPEQEEIVKTAMAEDRHVVLLDEECPVSCPLPEPAVEQSPAPSKPKQTRKSFSCTQCDQEFPTNKKMLIHMTQHTEPHEVDFLPIFIIPRVF